MSRTSIEINLELKDRNCTRNYFLLLLLIPLLAGRCFSCSHIGLGGPRVMRTTGQMGAAVGYAASLCLQHGCTPREIFEEHLDEYMQLVLQSSL